MFRVDNIRYILKQFPFFQTKKAIKQKTTHLKILELNT